MPRPRRCRRVSYQPEIIFFKPAGVRKVDLAEIILTVDELEAVRLNDLNSLPQEEAAKEMGISQPTFHRTLLGARKKISDAIVNGKAIRIEGGNYRIRTQGNIKRKQCHTYPESTKDENSCKFKRKSIRPHESKC